ncbi:glycerophosphodiester phosphodiesterase [Halegenticoccus tardaugens]|uniref:glycerophosphodiester phosphodiesterase n=1 Tax=Halegenticoccus tardaugens TaxID=2071624 RepID=UPI00100BE5A6|nr:glycerophosphodiester phosphodiesterase [Halegenticoccus tardaugens]
MSNHTNTLDRRRFIQGSSAAVTALALGSSAAAKEKGTEKGATNSAHRKQSDEPDIIAHRGFAGKYPENTVAAAWGSAREGADMIEIDVIPCADGEVVVFHDDDLSERDGGNQGLTDEDGLVWETDCETVLSAEVLESGETVPTLREVLKVIPASVSVNIEMKNPGSEDIVAGDLSGEELAAQEDLWRPFVQDVLAIAAEYQNDILVSSFYEAALSTTRETDPSIPIAFLFSDDIEEGLAVTREYDAEALHPSFTLVQGTPFYEGEDDIDLVEVAHEEGREVNVWTIQTWYEATQLAKTGVDGLIVDYPDLLFDSLPQ